MSGRVSIVFLGDRIDGALVKLCAKVAPAGVGWARFLTR